MVLMGVGERQRRNRRRVDPGFRHGPLKTANRRSPPSPSAVDENALNSWTGERKAIDGQVQLRSCLRSIGHRVVVRVAQEVRRHLDVAVRERPDAPRARRAAEDVFAVGCYEHWSPSEAR
jgi:hypothetical protein